MKKQIGFKNTVYFRQAGLLMRILPIIAKEPVFALKGGTAINFFVRNLPRLSIDIDLTYLPLDSRNTALSEITSALRRISSGISKTFPKAKIVEKSIESSKYISGMVIRTDVTVKIEVNTVIRGSVYKPKVNELVEKAEEYFGLSLSVNTLSLADLYGGKICAALDRQHPRDLFDVKLLFENEGITEETRKAFIVYLISHSRPIAEVLSPVLHSDLESVFKNEFKDMSEIEVSLDDIFNTRETLVKQIVRILNEDERKFLIGFKTGMPEWSLLGLDGIENLPAVQWKMKNLSGMDDGKREKAGRKLKKVLEV